jgi:hypothetical protein
MKHYRALLYIFTITLILIGSISCNKNKSKDTRVIVLGLDGLMPDAIESVNTPNIHNLIKDGTSTMKARAVYPTSSGPNWSSMILGCGPDQHGIDNNGWLLENRKLIPVSQKENGYSYSIFDLLDENYPNERLSAVFNWPTISNYFDSTIPDTIINVKSTTEAIDKIISEVVEQESMFVFSQIDHMDHAGHSLGFGTEKYNHEVKSLDSEIGRLIKSLKENNLYENTYIITLADHGGKGFGHGNKSIEEYTIPFIITGPGIQKGKSTSESIYTFDVATIVANIFNCQIPNHWIGTNIQSAFDSKSDLLSEFTPKTVISVDSVGQEFSLIKCLLHNSNSDLKIKYKVPSKSDNWLEYGKPVKLYHGDSIYASTFINNKPTVISSYQKPIIKHKGNNSEVSISTPPNIKYSSNGSRSLTDGFISKNESFMNNEWLGFQGDDLECILKFDKKQTINTFKFRTLENIRSWIFLPKSIKIYTSNNGKYYEEIFAKKEMFTMNFDESSVKEFEINLDKIETTYLKIKLENYGKLPEWHDGAGNDSWLFVDELIIE